MPAKRGSDTGRFARLLERIDALNRQDPNQEQVAGQAVPRELAYAQRLTDWVLRLQPDASEELRIAARGQHVQRWTIPRDRYPRTRRGYLQWREALKTFHAETVARLMQEVGYPEDAVQRVRVIMGKRQLPQDADTQTLEDALCLVFFEAQFADLRTKTPDEKMVEVLRKVWGKMSAPAREAALRLPMRDTDRALLTRAVGPPAGPASSP